jgi:very-short-patch-repair endonuclease
MKRRKARVDEAIEFARNQRSHANEFASSVWQAIRNRQWVGAKFRREYPIPPYTVDFCCVELKLVIEIDGEHHFTTQGQKYDRDRDLFLERKGFRVLRIRGFEVLRDPSHVFQKIRESIGEAKVHNPSPPAPLPERGEGGKRVEIDGMLW